MRSALVYIEPENIQVIPAELNLDAVTWDCGGLNSSTTPISLEDLFMGPLESVKLYGYFTYNYTTQLDRLFRNILDQNPEIQHMRWFFECYCDFPYSIQIDRKDLSKSCAMTYTLGYKNASVYYYTMDEHGDPCLDKEKLLSAWENYHYVENPKPVTQKETRVATNVLKKLFPFSF